MRNRIAVDAAKLRAAVADERYWKANHPESAAWNAWVTDAFQAYYNDKNSDDGGTVYVKAYTRNGRQVAAHTRSAPPSKPGEPDEAPAGDDPDDDTVPDDDETHPVILVGGRRRGPSGGAPDAPGGTTPRQAPPPVSSRSQEIIDIIEPGGRAIGTRQSGTPPNVRTMPGGDSAAREMFDRLTRGRNPVDVTPPNHPGRMVRLDDGSIISYRPNSRSGGPAIDINIPGYGGVDKIHY